MKSEVIVGLLLLDYGEGASIGTLYCTIGGRCTGSEKGQMEQALLI